MPAPDDPPFTLVQLGTAGSRRRASLAAIATAAGLGALIAIGALGGGTAPAPAPDQVATPGPSRSAETRQAVSRPRVVSVARAGYEVTYDRDASHRPVVLDRGALAIFGFGERVPNGAYPGTVHVAVGTPGHGAPVAGDGDLRRIYGSTLDALAHDYLDAIPIPPVADRVSRVVAARARLLEFADGRWVSLVIYGNRSFIFTATGFTTLYLNSAQPARLGLEAFLENFRFVGSLYVSYALGFEVPLPGTERPFGAAREGPPAEADGLLVFSTGSETGGTWSHSIGVAVGSEAHPALVEILPGSLAEPSPKRIWADSLVALQAAYLASIGGRRGSSSLIRIGGELALLVEGPNGLAAAALAVNHGRVYIISTTGSRVTEPAPGFEEFLEAFEFIDPS